MHVSAVVTGDVPPNYYHSSTKNMAPLREKLLRNYLLPIPVVACLKGLDYGHSMAANAGSNPSEGMDVRLLCVV